MDQLHEELKQPAPPDQGLGVAERDGDTFSVTMVSFAQRSGDGGVFDITRQSKRNFKFTI